MTIKERLKSFLHKELFFLDPSEKQAFKYALINDRLRRIFADNGCALGSVITFLSVSVRKWKLLDGENVYLVKDFGERLVVFKEKCPRTCLILETILYRPRKEYYELDLGIRRWCFAQTSALKKRWIDSRGKLLVNIGAGNWYVRNWKVLEYNGQWYRFCRSFVDYEHDLTGNQRLPFADNLVWLFYSEHVFEHLKDGWCEHAFKEAYRCLQPGGGFRVVVPDADLLYERLLVKDETFFHSWMCRDNISLSEAFLVLVGHPRSPLDEQEFEQNLSRMPKEEFLDWCKAGLEYDLKRTGEHINWFNFDKLARMLGEAGFQHVRRSAAQQSIFSEARGPGFDTRPWYSVHVECLK